MTSDEAIQKVALAYIPTNYKMILKRLGESELDTKAIAEYLGMTVGSAHKLLMILRGFKVICITGYNRDTETGPPMKVWGIGNKDVKPPKSKTSAERSREWRSRKAKLPRARSLDPIMTWGLSRTTSPDSLGQAG